MPLYHLTSGKSVGRILLEGLKPLIGARSSLGRETEPAIYLFRDLDAVENALLNWFGETADENDTIALIEVDDNGLELSDGADYEAISRLAIGPEKLRLTVADVDNPNMWRDVRKLAPTQ